MWSGQPGGCGDPDLAVPTSVLSAGGELHAAVLPDQRKAFDKTNASASLFPATPRRVPPVTGNVLVRMVNAGLRMHVPSIVGAQTGLLAAGFGLIAEDGNPLPGVTRVQSEVFMAAGKTYDVMINVPAAGCDCPSHLRPRVEPVAQLDSRDGGMLAYIGVNGAGLPNTGAFASTGAVANERHLQRLGGRSDDSPSRIPCKGVIANDMNVYGVQLLGASQPPALSPSTATARSLTSPPERHSTPSPIARTAR